MKRLALVVLLIAGALTACTSGKSPGSVTGSIHGASYAVNAAISATLVANGPNGTRNALIVLSSVEDACPSADDPVRHGGEKTVSILLFDGNTAPSRPGTYRVVDPNASETPVQRAVINTASLDAACHNADQAAAISGSVSLTLVGGDVYIGNFDVVLDSGERITGSFNPSLCEDLPAVFKDPGTAVCKP